MMNKSHIAIAITISFSLLFQGCKDEAQMKSPSNSILKGVVTGNELAGKMLYLDRLLPNNEAVPLDSAVLDESGEISFGPDLEHASYLRLRAADDNFVSVILGPDDTLNFSTQWDNMYEGMEVKGTHETAQLVKMNNAMTTYYAKADSLNRIMQQAQAQMNREMYQMAGMAQQREQEKVVNVLYETIETNPASLAALSAVQQFEITQEEELYQKVHQAIKEKSPESPYLEPLTAVLNEMAKLKVGAEAPEIALETPDGESMALSDLRGEVVLIDFWASWCGPCRRENPNVVKMYQRFKDKGFEIYGVSLDGTQRQADPKRDWLSAIQADGLPWHHVSDLKGWQSEAAQTYKIRSIPATYLIGRDGKILAKDLRGPALEQKLEEVLEAS